jgi:CrcB protein
MARGEDEAADLVASVPIDPEVPDAGASRRALDPAVLFTVAAGGVAGTAARYGLGRAFPTAASTFPWTTLAINLSGSFLLGAFLAWLHARRPADRWLRPLIAVGVLGGYTTFSTAMVETSVLAKDGHVIIAALYAGLGVVGGLVVVALGLTVARRVVRC